MTCSWLCTIFDTSVSLVSSLSVVLLLTTNLVSSPSLYFSCFLTFVFFFNWFFKCSYLIGCIWKRPQKRRPCFQKFFWRDTTMWLAVLSSSFGFKHSTAVTSRPVLWEALKFVPKYAFMDVKRYKDSHWGISFTWSYLKLWYTNRSNFTLYRALHIA